MLVIKIGGAEGIDMGAVCADVARSVQSGERVVLVHGGSHETNQVSTQLGHPPVFLTSPSGFTSRYTDRTTLEIFAMVTAGKINTLLVEALQRAGANALGLSGADGRLLVAKRKESVRAVDDKGKLRVWHDDHTGTITGVNTALLGLLLDQGYLPVIAPLAISPESVVVNVDADRAAAMVAGALKADSLIILTNVPGLMRHYPDEGSLIKKLPAAGLEGSLSFAEGRMKKKVLGACEALEQGVKQVVFASGKVASPVQGALAGEGTVIS